MGGRQREDGTRPRKPVIGVWGCAENQKPKKQSWALFQKHSFGEMFSRKGEIGLEGRGYS